MAKIQNNNISGCEFVPSSNPYFIGHEEALSLFSQLLKKGNLPHAWMISGSKGIGKATLAYRIARCFLSQNSSESHKEDLFLDPADPVFIRIKVNSHPDLIVVEKMTDPKTGKKNTVIKVDDIRSINSFVRLTSYEGFRKIIIIDSVSDMNLNAANALLKVLEEPPENTCFLLINHNIREVLPTLWSRCLHVNLRDLSKKEVFEIFSFILPDTDQETKELLALISMNSPGKALEIYENEGILIYKRVKQAFIDISLKNHDTFHSLTEIAGNGEEDKDKWFLIITFLLQFILECLKVKSGNKFQAEDLIFPDIRKEASLFTESKSTDNLLTIFKKITELSNEAENLNLDRKTILLNILYHITN